MSNKSLAVQAVETLESKSEEELNTKVPAPVEYRTTSTGRPTLVGTRHCSECGRAEFHTKKFEKSQNPEDLNQRYTLCKGVCVYCYAQKRNKTAGSSLTVPQLEAKIKFYTDLLEQAKVPATN
jgi:sulfatase maturation enzyme AslB (radical SAM superfamily)